MKDTILIFETVKEEDCEIKFDTPLKIEAYQSEKDENLFYVDFDFGLSIEMSVRNFRMKGLPNNDEERISRLKAYIEFEIIHSYFHINMDPNYSILNWALFGNLAYRVECSEDCGSEGLKDITTWKYDKYLNMIYL